MCYCRMLEVGSRLQWLKPQSSLQWPISCGVRLWRNRTMYSLWPRPLLHRCHETTHRIGASFLHVVLTGECEGVQGLVNYPVLSYISLGMVKTIKIGLTCFNIPTAPKTTCHGDKTSGTFLPLVYIYSFSFNYTWTLFSPSSCLTDALAVLSIALLLTSAPIYYSR